MLGSIFYFSLIRKYVTVFGTVFNDIKIVRPDTAHNTSHTIDVPISYGPREKVLARLEQDPALTKMPAIQLPRMSFELTNFQYDPARKLQSTGRITLGANTNVQFVYTPVPYNLSFTLAIMSKNVDDAWRITEQILPYFTPEFTARVTLIPEMNVVRDIPIILDATRLEDLYQGSFEERRLLTAELDFTMKGYLYGPIRTGSNLITMANINFFDVTSNTIDTSIGTISATDKISWTPGQYANGAPTSNAAATINRNSIAANSNYGYVKTANTSL